MNYSKPMQEYKCRKLLKISVFLNSSLKIEEKRYLPIKYKFEEFAKDIALSFEYNWNDM